MQQQWQGACIAAQNNVHLETKELGNITTSNIQIVNFVSCWTISGLVLDSAAGSVNDFCLNLTRIARPFFRVSLQRFSPDCFLIPGRSICSGAEENSEANKMLYSLLKWLKYRSFNEKNFCRKAASLSDS